MNSEDFHQLIGAFFAEAQEFLQLLETNLLAMESSSAGDVRSQLVKEMFRAAHSIKGSALMFGFEELAKAAHVLEDCFAIVRDGTNISNLNQTTITALLEGVDHLKKIANKSASGDSNIEEDFKAIAQIKEQLETEFGKKTPPPVSVSKNAAGAGLLKAIFENEVPPIINRLESEISQAKTETLEKTLVVINEIYYQLSGLSGMLQLPEFGEIADRLRPLIDAPNLSLEQLKSSGWAVAQNLQAAREQICSGQAINVPAVITEVKVEEDLVSPQIPETEELKTEEKIIPVEETVVIPQPQAPAPNPISSTTVQRPTIRIDLERLTELVNLVGELVINRTNLELQESQLRSEVKRIRRKILDLNHYGGQLREEYDRMSIGDGEWRIKNEEIGLKKSALSILNSVFDSLEMDEYTEFHSTAQEVIETTQAISQSASKIDELASKFERSTDHLRRITDQLRSRVMQLRVVAFSRAVDHVPRALRDLCQAYNKEVNLLLLGRDTKIDESLLDALRDPLVHLVRNAFDHGIEPPEVRKAIGKSVSGQIEIEARHQGGQTIITVTDDGKGIDPEAIRRQIVAKEFMTVEQAQELSTAELYEFLFWPGFSTVDKVQDLSGRGVGLDVVRTNLRQVRGTVKVDSRPGKGTSFILKLPLMLSITEALLVKTDRNTVAVPLDAVEEILHLQAHQVHRAGTQPMVRWRDEFVRLVRLQELIHYSILHPDGPSPDPIAQDYIPVLVLASSEGILATAVERIVGQQEIVVKPLPAPLSKPHGVVGCTILGDGRVVTILDVDDLVSQFQTRNATAVAVPDKRPTAGHARQATTVPVLLPSKSHPQILVVDDSYAIRQLLGLALTRARYRVVQAKDGQDALEKLQTNVDFSLVIADIEMPRMDGFELLREIKSDPKFAAIPVAMLTSRSGAKHRQMALELGASHYFTKPYSEPHLLEVIAQLIAGYVKF
ncbi:hybrid sensor histidine kinase/response regulator [Microcoleus sp. FACHB-672]|uniref:hybrid sensor histidine kinase/response regulator n=1 Tax=Microcoleus sp. FACHB-672 TaxID=2692825 RepID=UPI0016851ED5|nr:hybrid sensor histidine kinase/response regulator [Microcoleus sp. FACHB-672]MBD2041905.1 hybrid sensor histidine kinase/response regulator [Microcoleus sp. FACHB-672]